MTTTSTLPNITEAWTIARNGGYGVRPMSIDTARRHARNFFAETRPSRHAHLDMWITIDETTLNLVRFRRNSESAIGWATR